MAHSITPSSLVVESLVEADRRNARPDGRFLRRVTQSLRTAFIEVAGDGVPILREQFCKLDRSINEDNFEADIWRFKAILKGPTGLTDKDLDLLFTELWEHSQARLDETADTGAPMLDLAEVLVYFRRLFGHPTAQFHSILKRVRSKRPEFAQSPFNEKAAPSRLQVYEYLVTLGLTQSEAFWILEQSGDDNLDVDYLVNCLYAFPLPDDIAFPLLMNKVVECVCDRLRDFNGTAGMQQVMQRVLNGNRNFAFNNVGPHSPVPSPAPSGSPAGGSSPSQQPRARKHARFTNQDSNGFAADSDSDSAPDPALKAAAIPAAPVDGVVNAALFRTFALSLGAGLSSVEADLLFQYVADPATKTVSAAEFINLVAARFPLLPRQELVHIAAEVRGAVVANSFGGLCHLHCIMSSDPSVDPMTGALPLDRFCAILRSCGVGSHIAADVDLEYLHKEAPTCVGLVLFLRGNMSQSRESVLRKLFARLDHDNAGVVSRERVLACFEPEAADPKVCNRAAERKDGLAQYLRTLPPNDPYLSYAEFSYYWGNVSASVGDDAPFIMLLWQAYGMQRTAAKLVPVSSASRQRLQAVEGGAVIGASPSGGQRAHRSLPPQHATDSSSGTPPPAPPPQPVSQPREAVRTSVAITNRNREAPITCAIPMGASPPPVSRRRTVPGHAPN